MATTSEKKKMQPALLSLPLGASRWLRKNSPLQMGYNNPERNKTRERTNIELIQSPTPILRITTFGMVTSKAKAKLTGRGFLFPGEGRKKGHRNDPKIAPSGLKRKTQAAALMPWGRK